jgi:hypothetical protein
MSNKEKSKVSSKVSAKKETKKPKKVAPKADRENIGAADYSKTTNTLLSAVKKIGGKTEQTTPGTIRAYLEDSPILRITGLTREMPTVYIRPKLRTSENGKEALESFREKTGITKTAKLWKRVGGGSGAFFYTGEKPEAMLAGVSKYLSRAHKIVA